MSVGIGRGLINLRKGQKMAKRKTIKELEAEIRRLENNAAGFNNEMTSLKQDLAISNCVAGEMKKKSSHYYEHLETLSNEAEYQRKKRDTNIKRALNVIDTGVKILHPKVDSLMNLLVSEASPEICLLKAIREELTDA